MSALDIRIGDLKFDGGLGNEGFFIREWSGWTKRPGEKREDVPVQGGDGDYTMPGYLEPRILTFAGPCITTSAEKMEQYGERLACMFTGGVRQVFVDGPGGTLWGWAQLQSDGPDFDPEIWGKRNQYQVVLKFPKPYKFGEPAKTGFASGEAAYHYGNYKALPIQTISGSAPGYTLYGPNGRRVVVDIAVTPGHDHVIDFSTMTLFIDGSQVHGHMPIAQFWPIPGGAQVVQTLVPTSGALSLSSLVRKTSI